MNRNIFEQYYQKYDKWYDEKKFVYLSELQLLKKVLSHVEGLSLEIGVGSGRFASELNIRYGLEPAFNAIKVASSRGVISISGVGESLPFKDNSFDLILSLTVFEFVNDLDTVLNEIRRVLVGNGILLVSIIDADSFLGKIYKSSRESIFYSKANIFSASELLNILNSSKFEVVEIYQTLFKKLEKIEESQNYKKGFGEGGYVVFKAVTKK